MDVAFNLSKTKIANASSDNISKIFDFATSIDSSLVRHKVEVSKVMFEYRGNNLLTGSSDGTCKIWSVNDGKCLQTLD